MIDYKTFKKEYLNEWVDQSQAARKAAEELAMRDTASILDKYRTRIVLVGNRQIEFKGENEKNPDDPKYDFFTYDEAMERFGKPNKDGWRLPTSDELWELKQLPYEWKDKSCVFDARIVLPALGYVSSDGTRHSPGRQGEYWASDEFTENVEYILIFNKNSVVLGMKDRKGKCSVRLVRDVK